ncbi:MAG: dihydrofolate reductase [Bacteroidales bacterium]|nr:dihydrofolate reductase [Bacteroidales bacterium]HOK98406.1 dihydrofolate reductase [Bacteroidales bacterium]
MNIRRDKSFAIIAAIARNYAIGLNGTLPWHIPEDFKWFKKNTLGHTVIMGKNTFWSLPRRPLPGRRNIVITHASEPFPEGVEIAHSFDEAVRLADVDKENFIIGGASIYQQFFPLVDRLYITLIDKDFQADTFFPAIDEQIWQLTAVYPQLEEHPDGLHYEFRIYRRKRTF